MEKLKLTALEERRERGDVIILYSHNSQLKRVQKAGTRHALTLRNLNYEERFKKFKVIMLEERG